MSCQVGHPEPSRRRSPWYVWCGVGAVLLGLVMVALGASWTNLIIPTVALAVAWFGWQRSGRSVQYTPGSGLS